MTSGMQHEDERHLDRPVRVEINLQANPGLTDGSSKALLNQQVINGRNTTPLEPLQEPSPSEAATSVAPTA